MSQLLFIANLNSGVSKMSSEKLLQALEQAKRDGDQGRVYEIEKILSARS